MDTLLDEEGFDWVKFHSDLDSALALWIIHDPDASVHETLEEFISYSHTMRQLQLMERSAEHLADGNK